MDPIGFFVQPMTYGFMQRGLVAAAGDDREAALDGAG